ncbi:MAG: hypothetical protein K0B02_01775 [DPANN group archaeon]|nr:hypothetical protein [DPANN group archaeon]
MFGIPIESFLIAIVLIISAIPLYFSIKLLGGQASFLKVILVNLAAGLILSVFELILGVGGILGFVILIFIYKEMFDMTYIGAFLAWLLQFIIALILILIFIVIGISVII